MRTVRNMHQIILKRLYKFNRSQHRRDKKLTSRGLLNCYLIKIFENILNTNVQLLKENGLGDKSCDDILKRVKIFVTNWAKLNSNVKLKMYNLTKGKTNI